jgi:enamine deaminase RidA (YjgF/YER057c/UK114 family)
MTVHVDRRTLLKTLGCATVAAGASGVGSMTRAWAQSGPARPSAARLALARATLQNGIILHAGETSMELYHRHPHDPKEEIVQPEDIRLQTRLTMRNHKEILDWMGLGWKNVVKLTRYQKRMDESAQIEEVLASYFKDELPPMTVYEINGLSSPQARLEIDMWINPGDGRAPATAGPVKGIDSIFPRPEVTDRMAYAPGIKIPRDMDLLFFSGLTAYPWEVDPWNPGPFAIPSDPAARARLATEHLDGVLKMAGIGWQHIINNVNYTAPAGGGINFRERWGTYSPCSTSLRVADTGVPGATVLYQLNAAAPRKAIAGARGVVGGIEPILHRSGVALKDLPGAPAMRVSSDVDLVFFSGITGGDDQTLADNVDRALKSAGLSWQHTVLLALTGEVGDTRAIHARLGEWRPCLTRRAVGTGIQGARVMCEVTAVSPRRRTS